MARGDRIQLSLPLTDLPVEAPVVRAVRPRVLLSGKIVHSGGAYSIDCVIRNISRDGAMITLARHQTLPPDVHLIVVKQGIVHQAKVVWFNYPARGLRFLRTFSLNADLPDDMRFLRNLWLELSARPGLQE